MNQIKIAKETDEEIPKHMGSILSFIEGLLLIGVGLFELSKYLH
ncbi:MAG: hypothetical protein P4L69_15510 [Desulfosporosinus sp.]|nr:hypothetical protein [Desulfosporosinus sp.]